jgi:hypothetical protein
MTLISERLRPVLPSRAALPAALLLLAGGILTSDVLSSEAVSAREAAASCSLNVASRVAISSPYVNPTFALGADCAAAGVIDARWEAKRADGVVMKKAYFNFDYPASWAVFDATSLSPWTWQPVGAVTRDDPAAAEFEQTPTTRGTEQIQATVPQNTPTTDIRMMSVVQAVESSDCRNHIQAQRYAITPHGFINYGGRTGSIQQLNPTTGGWFVLGSFTTDSTGHAVTDTVSPSPEGTIISIRIVIYDGPYIFGSISPTYTGPAGGPDPCGSTAAATSGNQPTILGLRDPKVEVSNEVPGPLPEPPSVR